MNREVICFDAVAPARERGLKFPRSLARSALHRRSREGAWIEIANGAEYGYGRYASLPRGSVD